MIILLILTGIWSFLDDLLEFGIESLAEESGYSTFELDVKTLDLWQTEIQNLRGSDDSISLEIDDVKLLYDPSGVALGRFNAISVSGVKGKFIFDKNEEDSNESDSFSFHKIYEPVDALLDSPPVNYIRIRDSVISTVINNIATELSFFIKADFFENLFRFSWDGMVNKIPAFAELNLSREENATFLSATLEINELAKLFDEIKNDPRTESEVLDKINLFDGSLKLDAYAQLFRSGLDDIFIEANGSEISLRFDENNFIIPKIISFFSLNKNGDWGLQSYAHLVQEENLIAEDIKISINQGADDISLDGSITYLETQNKFPKLEVHGLRFPRIQISNSNSQVILVGKEKQISYDQISYEDTFLKLYNGVLSFLFLDEQNVSFQLPAVDALLSDFGLSFVQFSYFGSIDLDEFPRISTPQLISGKRVISDDRVLLEHLALSFRLKDFSEFLIDMLSFEFNGYRIELDRFNVAISESDPDFLFIEFNNSQLDFPDNQISLSGLNGKIQFNNMDPLETNGTQIITFEKCEAFGKELKDGNFSFEVMPNGLFTIKNAYASIFNGEIGLRESNFNLYGDEMRLNGKISNINGQKIADMIEGLEVEVNGSFSGSIPIVYENGKWDFEKGYLQLDSSVDAKLKYRGPGFFTLGVKEGTREYEKMRMAEKALENLDLESMKIILEVNGDERKILSRIKGTSYIDEKNKVTLDYRPKIIAGLADLIYKIKF